MNSQVQLKRMKYEGGSNANDKCIEKLVRVIMSKDYSQMKRICNDMSFAQDVKQAEADLEKHQAAFNCMIQ